MPRKLNPKPHFARYFALKKFAAILAITIITLANTTNHTRAQQVQDLINQQDWITRQQQNEIEEQKRYKEQDAIEKERARKQKEGRVKKQQPEVSATIPVCFAIKEIKLNNAESISKRQQKKLTSPFLAKCFEAKILSEIITKIQSYYNEKGYVAARVSVPKQNIQSGVIELNVLEGKIDEIIVGNNSFGDKMQEFTAFGINEGNVLQIEDINQGVYQINRLPSNSAKIKIEPSDNEGEAKVYVVNEKKFPVRTTIGYDNLGNEFTGIKRTNFSGSLDNLLFLNDNINLNYSTNLNDDSQKKDIKSLSSSISIPLGYNTISYDFSRSEFLGQSEGIVASIRLSGYSQRNNITFGRVLLNKGNLRISNNLSLTSKSSASYLNKQKIEVSERRLAIGTIGFLVSNYFKNGANIYLKPSYSRGLKILNAKQDESDSISGIPKAQFEIFKLYGSLSKQVVIPKLEFPVLLSTEIDSQHSKDTLFGSEQFSVGGYYSVQGFRENYITGDSGYYARNKANFNIGSLFKGSDKNLVYLDKFSLEPFYDYGHVRNKYNGSSGRLSGTGVKTIFNSRYFNASLTYSWAVNHSKLITSPKTENKLVYFEISAGY